MHRAYIVSICKSSIIFKRTLQGNQHILSLDTTSWVSGENASVAAIDYRAEILVAAKVKNTALEMTHEVCSSLMKFKINSATGNALMELHEQTRIDYKKCSWVKQTLIPCVLCFLNEAARL